MSDLSYLQGRCKVLFGDALARLPDIQEPASCIVTSPPYWQLRDYDHPKQLGLEPQLQDYIDNLVTILRAAREVLASGGTLWLNLGDTYIAGRSGGVGASTLTSQRNHDAARRARRGGTHRTAKGLKQKDLCGVPWRVALALQADGWWLRSEVIWRKPNAMPESVLDRPTRNHEHVFLLSKSATYYYDADALRTPLRPKTLTAHGSPARRAKAGDATSRSAKWAGSPSAKRSPKTDAEGKVLGANARTVWDISQEPWPGAHTSTFPTKLAKRCILAGSPPGGLVLDPFAGTGTSLAVAVEAGRRAVGIELNPANLPQIEKRMAGLQLPLLPESLRG